MYASLSSLQFNLPTVNYLKQKNCFITIGHYWQWEHLKGKQKAFRILSRQSLVENNQ